VDINSAARCSAYSTRAAWGIIPVALFSTLCVKYLDRPISLLVQQHLFSNTIWARHTSSLPDLLLITVLFTAAASYTLYRRRLSRGIVDLTTLTCKMLAFVAPASFVIKSALKIIFGRTNTREWLLAPDSYGFHWFQGGGAFSAFPSGHMAVFTALLAVVWRLHPRYRAGCCGILLLLSLALVATNYHFLSDVLAGAYLGVVIEAVGWHVLAGPEKVSSNLNREA